MKPDAPVTRAVVKGNLAGDCKRRESYYSHSERGEDLIFEMLRCAQHDNSSCRAGRPQKLLVEIESLSRDPVHGEFLDDHLASLCSHPSSQGGILKQFRQRLTQ